MLSIQSTRRILPFVPLMLAFSACYEPVPPLPGATATSGTSTTDPSAGDGGDCESTDAPPRVACGDNQSCTSATQVCCHSFMGEDPPTLSCACPGACGPGASEFQCDDSGDCETGQVCCAVYDLGEEVVHGSCQPASDCSNSMSFDINRLEMCHPDVPGGCAPEYVCVWLDAPEVPPAYGVCLPKPYLACIADGGACLDGSAACLVVMGQGGQPTMGTVCSIPCDPQQLAFPCPPPTTGSAEPFCPDNGNNGKSQCMLDCSNGKTCPDGMTCVSLPNGDLCLFTG